MRRPSRSRRGLPTSSSRASSSISSPTWRPRSVNVFGVARPGATIAAYVWDYAAEMEPIRAFWDAAIALDPAARDLDEARRFPLCAPGRAAKPLRRRRPRRNRQPRDRRSWPRFASFDDYWTPFLSGTGPAPGYCAGLPGRQARGPSRAPRRALPARARRLDHDDGPGVRRARDQRSLGAGDEQAGHRQRAEHPLAAAERRRHDNGRRSRGSRPAGA